MSSADTSARAGEPSRTWPARPASRGSGAAIWLLRAADGAQGETAQRDLALVFAAAEPAFVLSAPSGPERELAAAIAERSRARLVLAAELQQPLAAEKEVDLVSRAWSLLERALLQGGAGILCVLPPDLIRILAALLLGIPPARSRALRVDPGRAVLILNGELGFVLRRSNVAAPEPASPASQTGG